MAGQSDLFRAALHSFVTEQARAVTEHPSLEDLLAYYDGVLPEVAVGALQDHLCLCAECREVLLDRAEFSSPALSLDEGTVESAWEQLRTRLEHQKERFNSVPSRSERSQRTLARHLRFAYGLAASLFFAVLGLSTWGVSLRRQISEIQRPPTNAALFDLAPEATRGGASSFPVIDRTADSIVLILPLESADFPSYRIDLVDSRGRICWSVTGQPSPDKILHLIVARDSLPTGKVTFALYGLHGQLEELVAKYPARIE
jgi:hypothetical protein